MKVWKVYSSVNCADTMRDPDDYHIKDICVKYTLEDAISAANEYAINNFLGNIKYSREVELKKDGTYAVSDVCSYGETVIVECIDGEQTPNDTPASVEIGDEERRLHFTNGLIGFEFTNHTFEVFRTYTSEETRLIYDAMKAYYEKEDV